MNGQAGQGKNRGRTLTDKQEDKKNMWRNEPMHDKINGKILRNNLDYIEQVEKLTKRLQYKHSISRNDLYSIVYTKERLSRIKDNSDENLKLNIDIAIKQLDMVLKAYSSEDISNILNKEYKHSKLDRQ